MHIDENHVDDYIPITASVGHLLYSLACMVSVTMCVVVESVSHSIIGRLIPDHDVWHARAL